MLQHKKTIHEGRGSEFQCNSCDYQATQKVNLTQHKKRIHEKGKDNECEKCDKKYFSKSELKIHTDAIHNGIVFKCNHCGKTFSIKSVYKRHLIIHSSVKHKCTKCAFETHHQERLNSHQVSQHSDTKEPRKSNVTNAKHTTHQRLFKR